MLEFLGFGRAKHDVVEAADTLPVSRLMPGEYPTPTQREMVRLTLHTLLKRHGIPAAWLGAELVAFPTLEEPEGLLLQLTVLHWHAGFGLYAPALQQELMEGLKRFDSQATARKYHLHWKFSPDSGCPHETLPEPSYWTADAQETPLPTPPTPAQRAKFDLPNRPEDEDDADTGFAATQMHDMG